MRILLRKSDSNEYVWKEATYKKGHWYVGGIEISETNIAAVDGHNTEGKAMCSFCGEIIDNTAEAIQAHYEKNESERDCTKCEHLAYDSDKKQINRSVVALKDGTHQVKDEFIATLMCGISWQKRSLNDEYLSRYCKHFQCRRHGVGEFPDTFSKYPGVFDSAITSDVLVAKKFRFDGYDGKYFLYDMKSRGTIKACVNKSGVVECFRVTSNGTALYFYYSEKYDKMFYNNGSTYAESKPYWFRDAKYDEAHKKIKALYEGVTKE